MSKEKKEFRVIWEEKRSINVLAENEEQAQAMIHNCEYNEAETIVSFSNQPIAFEVIN